MTKAKEILSDTETLGQFSNVGTTAEAHSFRQKNPDFFPRNFWNWLVPQVGGNEPILTIDAASAEAVAHLKREPPTRFWRAFQHVLHGAWQRSFPLEESVRLISCVAVADRLSGKTDVEPDLLSYRVWPYQRAVMLLGVEPWRTRFCAHCGKRFVADKPARRFCSNSCSANARKESKRHWWAEKGEEWRGGEEGKEDNEEEKSAEKGRRESN